MTDTIDSFRGEFDFLSNFSNHRVVVFGREALIATGDAELIEGNWWHDTFWGVCNGEGENNLGKILMELREEFRND